MTALAVSLAGALGAAARYLISGWVQGRSSSAVPAGTFAVNMLGAFGLGLVLGAGDGPAPFLSLVGVGFFSGFTTFSTWMVETIRLGTWPRASLNLIVSTGGGVLVLLAGYMLTG